VNLDDSLARQHAGLSATHLQFLEFLQGYPPGREYSHFSPVHVSDEFTPFPVQSWPVFLGAQRRQRFERAAVATSRLIRSVPGRLLGGAPARLKEFYGLSADQAVLIASLIRSTGILEGAFARCDFLDTPQGLRCVELNAGNISGWQTAKYLERFAHVPAVRNFLGGLEHKVYYRNPVRELFTHFIGMGRDLAKEGELNLCFAVDSASHLGHWVPYLKEEYESVLAEVGEGLEGSLVACAVGALRAEDGVLKAEGRRIHIVHEPSFGRLTRPLLAALLAGKVRLFNGPTARVLADKGNLALLSESSDSDLLSAEERAAVEAWIPWTRRVVAGETDHRGEKVRFPEWLLERRADLVLKARFSLGGKEVHVGRFTPQERWNRLVAQALADGQWVVQEYLESPPYLFLARSGPALHDLVWGLFTFGNERYGGNFFRVQEKRPGGRGVVNATQGASFGLVLEVETAGESGLEPFTLGGHGTGSGA
jgi:hypothetical protein